MPANHMTLLYRDVDRLVYLAPLKRIAARHGLDLELVRHKQAGSEDWGERLRRGEIDTIAENYWGLQRFRAGGAPFVTFASSAHEWVEWLMVRGPIASIEDLRGKRFAVRDHGPQRSMPAVVLGRWGMLDDVEQVIILDKEVGRWGVWKAVADGRCDACFMTAAYAGGALAAGLKTIPSPPFAFEGALIQPTTTERYFAEHPAEIRALVTSMHETNRRIRNDFGWVLDAVKADCLEDLREHFTFTNDEQTARIVKALMSEVGENLIPTPAGLSNALEICEAQYGDLGGFNPLEMWDLTFARELLRAPSEVNA